jgi:hypothetical protein
MLALTALVMAATLATLLLQSTSPLLPILQDMDMCLPPPVHNRSPPFTHRRPGQSTPAPISTCTPAADGSHVPSSRLTSRALPALSLQSKRENSCPVAAACCHTPSHVYATASRAAEARGLVMASLSETASSKPGVFYKSCMDLAAISVVGVAPAATLIRNSMWRPLFFPQNPFSFLKAKRDIFLSAATNPDSLAASLGPRHSLPHFKIVTFTQALWRRWAWARFYRLTPLLATSTAACERALPACFMLHPCRLCDQL